MEKSPKKAHLHPYTFHNAFTKIQLFHFLLCYKILLYQGGGPTCGDLQMLLEKLKKMKLQLLNSYIKKCSTSSN